MPVRTSSTCSPGSTYTSRSPSAVSWTERCILGAAHDHASIPVRRWWTCTPSSVTSTRRSPPPAAATHRGRPRGAGSSSQRPTVPSPRGSNQETRPVASTTTRRGSPRSSTVISTALGEWRWRRSTRASGSSRSPPSTWARTSVPSANECTVLSSAGTCRDGSQVKLGHRADGTMGGRWRAKSSTGPGVEAGGSSSWHATEDPEASRVFCRIRSSDHPEGFLARQARHEPARGV